MNDIELIKSLRESAESDENCCDLQCNLYDAAERIETLGKLVQEFPPFLAVCPRCHQGFRLAWGYDHGDVIEVDVTQYEPGVNGVFVSCPNCNYRLEVESK